jgi:hypothetical protein
MLGRLFTCFALAALLLPLATPHTASAGGACRRSRCLKTTGTPLRIPALGYREQRAL